jgi:phosphate transport system substrate-binding protein
MKTKPAVRPRRGRTEEAIMRRWVLAAAAVAASTFGFAAARGAGKLAGSVRIDGSSTVFPVTEAVAEEFRGVAPKVQVTVGISGTGGGFKKFCVGETDINDASRPIDAKEVAQAAGKGIEFIELPVAYDGLTVVVNPENVFVDHLTVAELHEIWRPDSPVKRWKDVRPTWPDAELRLYGAGHDSGTFDYFTEAVNGKSKVCRSDYTASEDDNVLVQGVAGDAHALGFFGFAYFVENRDKLRAVPIDGGKGPVAPTLETIRNGSYSPLSRPIFIYVARKAADRPEVGAFVDFYLENAPALVQEVGYVPLPDGIGALTAKRWEARATGTVFTGGHEGRSLEDLLRATERS